MTDAEIDEKLRQADAKFSVMDLTEAILVVLRRHPKMTFADFESRLRAIGSNTYLVARPRGYRPVLGDLDVRFLDNKRAPFYLVVCIHGTQERDNQLAVWKFSAAQNMDALKQCGVLSVKERINKGKKG